MDYDVIVIGAGMSGLAAGVRLAHFDKRVCLVERHSAFGGLNSHYTLDGRQFDVGLHALTNYVKAGVRNSPLNKLLRQLRIPREALDLCEQNYCAVRFPGRQLRFGNDVRLLIDEIDREFPGETDAFRRLMENLRSFEDLNGVGRERSARAVLQDHFNNPLLIDMLLCPLMYYGCPQQHDMDYTQFSIMFRSIFLEGMARPRGGVRRIIAELVKRYRGAGGELRMNCGVQRLQCAQDHVCSVILDDGRALTAGTVISSAGYFETMALCDQVVAERDGNAPGEMTFVESISILDGKPADMGIDTTIVFFNDAESFTYAKPEGLIDARSGVICCPNNYDRHEDMAEGVLRLTSMANHDRWVALDEAQYKQAKLQCYDVAAERAVKFVPDFRNGVVYRDIFTPRTIRRYTGHINGAVYGAVRKRRDGRTQLQNLFLCGTDQGLLGIVGALVSGINMANVHVLSKD